MGFTLLYSVNDGDLTIPDAYTIQAAQGNDLQVEPYSVGLPIGSPTSLIVFDFKAENGNVFIPWSKIYDMAFKVVIFKLGGNAGGSPPDVPLQLLGKKNTVPGVDAKYTVSVNILRDMLKASPGDVIAVEYQTSGSENVIFKDRLAYFRYSPWYELYNNYLNLGVPGLHIALANSFSINPASGELDANPLMLAWGVKFYPDPINTPTFYVGISLAGFASIATNSSSSGVSNFSQATGCPLLIDLSNIISVGPAWQYNWTSHAFAFTIIGSIDASVLTALKK
jgi:hypothetical protein